MAVCIDQYNGSYKNELKELNDLKIHGLPDTIDEIDFGGNQHHRRYSHRGWNFYYADDRGNWNTRKEILLQTVNDILGYQKRAGKWVFLWIDKDYGYSKQCDAFAALLYYIHILTDYDASGYDEVYSDVMKIAVAHPSEETPDIFWEIERILQDLFKNQASDPAYSGLMTDIQMQANEARDFVRNTTDIKRNYSQYQGYAIALLEKLASKLPTLLRKEPNFCNTFYAGK